MKLNKAIIQTGIWTLVFIGGIAYAGTCGVRVNTKECGRPSSEQGCLAGNDGPFIYCNKTWTEFTASQQSKCNKKEDSGTKCDLVKIDCGTVRTGSCSPVRGKLKGGGGKGGFNVGLEVDSVILACRKDSANSPRKVTGGYRGSLTNASKVCKKKDDKKE